MKKPYFKTVLLFCFISFCIISCAENDALVSTNNENNFKETHNALRNTYYKNNNIKSVTSTNTVHKTIYHYNENGHLYKVDGFLFDENGNAVFSEYNSRSFELVYENNLLSKIYYEQGSLLTHSTFEYEDNLLIKTVDFRDEELFYFTDYEYKNMVLHYSKYTRLNSIGVRFGTSPVTFEYDYIYTHNGNISRIDVSYQGDAYEQGDTYEYNEDTNLPYKIGDNLLTYTYFN